VISLGDIVDMKLPIRRVLPRIKYRSSPELQGTDLMVLRTEWG
jgi:hypothetical protein